MPASSAAQTLRLSLETQITSSHHKQRCSSNLEKQSAAPNPPSQGGGDFPAVDGAWRALQDSPRGITERDSSSKSSVGVNGVCEFVESPPSMEDEEHRTPPARMLSAVLAPGKSQSCSGHPPPQRFAFFGCCAPAAIPPLSSALRSREAIPNVGWKVEKAYRRTRRPLQRGWEGNPYSLRQHTA